MAGEAEAGRRVEQATEEARQLVTRAGAEAERLVSEAGGRSAEASARATRAVEEARLSAAGETERVRGRPRTRPRASSGWPGRKRLWWSRKRREGRGGPPGGGRGPGGGDRRPATGGGGGGRRRQGRRRRRGRGAEGAGHRRGPAGAGRGGGPGRADGGGGPGRGRPAGPGGTGGCRAGASPATGRRRADGRPPVRDQAEASAATSWPRRSSRRTSTSPARRPRAELEVSALLQRTAATVEEIARGAVAQRERILAEARATADQRRARRPSGRRRRPPDTGRGGGAGVPHRAGGRRHRRAAAAEAKREVDGMIEQGRADVVALGAHLQQRRQQAEAEIRRMFDDALRPAAAGPPQPPPAADPRVDRRSNRPPSRTGTRPRHGSPDPPRADAASAAPDQGGQHHADRVAQHRVGHPVVGRGLSVDDHHAGPHRLGQRHEAAGGGDGEARPDGQQQVAGGDRLLGPADRRPPGSGRTRWWPT